MYEHILKSCSNFIDRITYGSSEFLVFVKIWCECFIYLIQIVGTIYLSGDEFFKLDTVHPISKDK